MATPTEADKEVMRMRECMKNGDEDILSSGYRCYGSAGNMSKYVVKKSTKKSSSPPPEDLWYVAQAEAEKKIPKGSKK